MLADQAMLIRIISGPRRFLGWRIQACRPLPANESDTTAPNAARTTGCADRWVSSATHAAASVEATAAAVANVCFGLIALGSSSHRLVTRATREAGVRVYGQPSVEVGGQRASTARVPERDWGRGWY